MTIKKEIRGGIAADIRSDDSGVVVSGYAAVFNQRTDIAGYFYEVIMPGAFLMAIGRDDVSFLIEHGGLPLARTRSGTLTLTEDSHGLKIDTTLDPNDPDVARIVPKMKRGDLDKMSFGFYATRQEWDESGDVPIRYIHEATLFDVSIVSNPAYHGTEIALRSLQDIRTDLSILNIRSASKLLGMKVSLDLAQRRI